MKKVLLADIDQLDTVSSFAQVHPLESLDDLDNIDEGVAVLAPTGDHLSSAKETAENETFIAAKFLKEEDLDRENLKVYFDLENYPFYQQAKQVIEQEEERKGVFRYRRTVSTKNDLATLAEDVYVLTTLFGEAESLSIKQTDQNIVPSHTIITINFGEGTMAHIEYTVSDRERIELEWSGVKNIIEFDSDEMSPIQPIDQTKLPLLYTVDAVIANAHTIDRSLFKQFNELVAYVSGGGEE